MVDVPHLLVHLACGASNLYSGEVTLERKLRREFEVASGV